MSLDRLISDAFREEDVTKMTVGRDEHGDVLIIDRDHYFAASRLRNRWFRGIHFSSEEVLEDVEPEAAALALVGEARTALAAPHRQGPRQVGPRTEATFRAARKGNPALEREEFLDELEEFGVDLTQ